MTPPTLRLRSAVVTALVTLSGPLLAQEQPGFALPEACGETSMSDDHGMDHGAMAMSSGDGMPGHVRENMARMRATMPAMERGMMQEDADIAFACGMIAHHQAAIDMADVVLEHGQDEEMRGLAEEIVATQRQEIEVMTEWLARATD